MAGIVCLLSQILYENGIKFLEMEITMMNFMEKNVYTAGNNLQSNIVIQLTQCSRSLFSISIDRKMCFS